MAEMNYSNPFGGMDFNVQTNQFGSMDPLALGAAIQRADLARPFIERMNQEQDLSIQKKQQELQEFMSPGALAARQAENQTKALGPQRLMQEIKESDSRIKNAGLEAEQKAQKAQLEFGQLKGKQEEGFYLALVEFQLGFLCFLF